MLGYNGGMPTAVYYNCLSGVDIHSAFFRLILIIGSEMPLYHCMCVQATGEDDNPNTPNNEFWQESCFQTTLLLIACSGYLLQEKDYGKAFYSKVGKICRASVNGMEDTFIMSHSMSLISGLRILSKRLELWAHFCRL